MTVKIPVASGLWRHNLCSRTNGAIFDSDWPAHIKSTHLRPFNSMEKIVVTSHFHTGHRQLNFPGKCKYVHGHTWRGKMIITTEEFPRDEIDMSLEFGELKQIMRDLDHKIIVTEDDKTFLDESLFEPAGVKLIAGKGPSVENVALHVYRGAVNHIQERFPGQNKEYTITVEIQETDNNFFSVEKKVTV